MSKKQGKPKVSSSPQNSVSTTKINNKNTKILFSYEYLDLNNSKYSFNDMDNRLIVQFHSDYNKKIKEYCTKDNFKKSLSEKLWKMRNHIHPIDWKDPQIRESCFTSLDTKLMEQIKDDCWQLGINSTTFRIHGFFIENVFYIVWIDPKHNLYHSK